MSESIFREDSLKQASFVDSANKTAVKKLLPYK